MMDIIEKIMDENNHDIIKMVGNHHEVIKFEQVAVIEMDEYYYAILHPLASDVEKDEVFVFRMNLQVDPAVMELEEDEAVILEIFSRYEKLYQEKKKK